MGIVFDDGAIALRARTPQGCALVKAMTDEVEAYRAAFKDDPAVDSGWGHAYFCSGDGAFLIYDLHSPAEHFCPVCGKAFSGEPYDASWVNIFRYNAIQSATIAAALYRIGGGEEHLEHVKRILGFYAENYELFADHGRGKHIPSGNGKITPQALNEAIIICKAVLALELCGNALGGDFICAATNKLLLPAAWFIEDQKRVIHNIPCWINAAVGAVGLYAGNTELVERAFDRPLGLADQVRQGVTADKFWYEGSIHYSHFTMEAFMYTLIAAKLHDKEIPQDVRSVIFDMFTAVLDYSFSNGTLPNPNDGWPNLNLKTYLYIYEMSCAVFDDGGLRDAIARIYDLPCERVPVPLSAPFFSGDYCLEWLLFSRDRKDGGDGCETGFSSARMFSQSKNFAGSNFAILRGGNVEVFLKYGHRTPSHAHPDKLNIEIMAYGQMVSRDISNCGYAARLCPEYHRTGVGHNTVTVDGQNQVTTNEGKVIRYDPQKPCIAAVNEGAYDGVDFARSVELTPDGVEDLFTVTSGGVHIFDWFFHVENSGKLLTELDCAPAELGFDSNGYQHLVGVQKVACGGTLTLKWSFPGGISAEQVVDTADKELFIAQSYDNPASCMRTVFILRARASAAEFGQSWRFER